MLLPVVLRIRRLKCDIVYTNTITVCVGAFAAGLLQLPHICHIREFGYEDHGLVFNFGQDFSLWLMDKLSSIFIANSKAVAQKYERYLSPSKLKVVYQSVGMLEDELKEGGTFPLCFGENIRCVMLGSLSEGKGQADAIRAVAELVGRGMKVDLFLVGNSNRSYRKYCYDLVTEKRIEKYVKFMNYLDNPAPLIRSADVLLMCSRCEAFGRVTVEAMKLGKPVIGARSGGTAELIRSGFNGFLYTSGDYRDLAEKILSLYEDKNLAQQMGRNAQKWAKEKFNDNLYGKEILEILVQAVDNK
jgi:glycosyltransferase involved in cell wall biosynthesis